MGDAHDPIVACAESRLARKETNRRDSYGVRTAKHHITIIVARSQEYRDGIALFNALRHLDPGVRAQAC